MPPKVRFAKDKIIACAVTLIEAHGAQALTARNVAEKLGASTTVVYHHFADMDGLAMEVMKRTQKMLLEYTSRPYSDRVFLNIGTGVAMFALEHPQLYRALLLESNSYRGVVQEFLDILKREMKKDARFGTLSDTEREVLLQKMWTFTHGLASLICVGLIKRCNQQYIMKALINMGTDVIGATLARHQGGEGRPNPTKKVRK